MPIVPPSPPTTRVPVRAAVWWRRHAMRGGMAAAALVAMGVAALAAQRAWQDAHIVQRWPAPGTLVDVGGHRLHLRCMGGGGAPPIVLEAGMGGWSQDWAAVQPLLARGGRVCAYDRAGYGWSGTPMQPRTGLQAVQDLRRALDAAGLPSPRVLAGHSMGGLLVGLYARTYPQDVAGLAFVDAVGRDYAAQFPAPRYAAFRASLGRLLAGAAALAPWGLPQAAGLSTSLVAVRLPLPERDSAQAWGLSVRHYRTLRAENEAFDGVLAEALAAGPLPRVPVRVLGSGKMNDFPPGLEDEAMRTAWVRNQERIAQEAGVVRVVLARSGHYLHLDEPQAVAQALDGLRAEARVFAQRPHNPL